MNIWQSMRRVLNQRRYHTVKRLLIGWRNIYSALLSLLKIIWQEIRIPWFCFSRRLIIRKYLKSHQLKKLQVGSGANPFGGWLNTDFFPKSTRIVHLDARENFPFLDQSFHYIFLEHMIEHLHYQEAASMLKECCRVLKPRAKIRISTPDLQIYLDLFTKRDDERQKQYLKWIQGNWLQRSQIYSEERSFILNLVMRGWGHQFIYDFNTLVEILEQSGFRNVRRYSCGESEDEHFKGLEKHGAFIGNADMNDYETLVVEAIKG